MIQAELTGVHQALDKACQRVRRGRRGDLVLRQHDLAVLFRVVEHAVDKIIRTDAVQPRGAHDNVLVGQLAHQLLAGVLALAVHGGRMRVVELAQRRVIVAVEYVIGRDLDELRIDTARRDRKVSRTDGVDLVRFLRLFLAGAHIGQTGAVDDNIRVVEVGKAAGLACVLDRDVAVARDELIVGVAAEPVIKRRTEPSARTRDPYSRDTHSASLTLIVL